MTSRKFIQFSLILIGLFLILATYFLYPKIIQEKSIVNLEVDKEEMITEEDETNTFQNVEYKGLYNFNQPFTVQSETASILTDEPDVVYMNKMKVTLYLSNGKIVIITSDRGSYNKIDYDCFFQDNVKATDGRTTITSERLDLLATEDYAVIYNNVFMVNDEGSLLADKINYDFETEFYNVSMFSDEKVKIKLIK